MKRVIKSVIKGKDQILEKMLEELRSSIKGNFPRFLYVTNVTESKNGTFYVMIRKKREKKVGEEKKLFETIKDISECVYKHYYREPGFFLMNCFAFFCLLKNHSNYHFHFLIIKNEYICSNNNSIF